MNETLQFSDETQWLQAAVAFHNKAMRAQWEFAMVLRDGLDKFGWHDKKKAELVEQLATQLDLKPSTLQKTYQIVKSEQAKIALALRLSFQHARVAYDMKADISLIESMLCQAAEWQWEPDKMRYEILERIAPKISSKSLYEEPPIIQHNVTPVNVPPPPTVAARNVIQIASSVNRDKYLTTTGANLPVAMTFQESYALDVCNHLTSDGLNWTRGDRYNRMVSDLKTRARRENWQPAKLQAEITGELWKMATNSHTSTETILLNAATAAAFPNERWQTITIGYAHHELLRNSEVAGEWLARAEANKWTPEQLDAQMHPHRSNDDIIINIIKGVQGIQLDEQAITLTSAHGKLIITQWRIEQ